MSRTVEALREHVRAAHVVAERALARLQDEPTARHLDEFEAATKLELAKRAELDAAIAAEPGAFAPPTAAEILSRMASDPQYAAIVAEHVSADIEWSSSFMAGAHHARHLDARVALVDAHPGMRQAQDEQMRRARERDEAECQAVEAQRAAEEAA